MDRKTIKTNLSFRKKCEAFGISLNDFAIYEDIIILKSPKKDIFVLLDENYNTIGIHKLENTIPKKSIEEYAIQYRELYSYVDDNDFALTYPFQNFSIKQIVDLANRVQFYRDSILVNDKYVLDNSDNVYISLLAYIKFLKDQIDQYFLRAYQSKMLGFEYPEIHAYLRIIMANIDECIKMYIDKKTRPFPIDIVRYLGQDKNNIDLRDSKLYIIIDLLLNEKGFKIIGGLEHYRDIETIDKCEINLADVSPNLLKILEDPKDKIKTDSTLNKQSSKIETINLQTWLEQDLHEEKKLHLTNTPNC